MLKGITRNIMIISIVVVIVIAAVGGYLYYLSTQRPVQVGEIKIGLLFPLTGSMAPLGIDELTGARIAIDLINERGGILGKYKINYVIADCKSDPKVAASEAERLITIEKVPIIIGTYASPLALAATEVAARYPKDVVYLEISAITDSLTLRNFSNILRNMPIAADYAIVTAMFLKDVVAPKLGKTPRDVSVAIIYEDGPYGTSVAAGLEKMLRAFGFNIVLKEAYSASTTDLSPLILKLKGANPEVIAAAGYYTDTVLFFRQAKELGLKFKVLIGHAAGHSLPATYEAVGKDMDYIFVTDAPPPLPRFNASAVRADLRPLMEEFVKRFEKERGYKPGVHANLGFANVLPLLTDILPRVIERFGKVDAESILKVIYEIDIPDGGTPMGYGLKFASPANPSDTVLGQIWRADQPQKHIGQNIRAKPVVLQWIDGVTYVVYPREYAVREPIIPLPPSSPYAK
ncbi:MAG: ABC transporter substrate-binding protein [Sulfolobales archaeon]